VRTRGNLSANDGEVALAWALQGHGILMRAEWDVARHLASGALIQVLPRHHTPEAGVYAVHSPRQRQWPRVRAFVDLLARSYGSAGGER
jgi:LysR family transcriptional activator of dmlA